MRGSGSRVLVAVVALAGVLIGGVGPVLPADAPADKVLTAPPELARFNDLLADLAERLKPAIVHVRVRREAPTSTDDSQEPQERRASGSGFLIDPEGVIVTNAHVVEDVTTAPLADSNRVRVGEFVLALGHPFGLEHTVSFGIVSRKGAPLTVAAPGFDFIQTDAAINPGNSGGPLVNMAGQVIGVNSMAARNGSIGFAIPSNVVKMLTPQLMAKGTVEWGWLGVSITEVGDDDVPRLKLRDSRGVLIRSVMPGEPADQGGVRPNDVIVALDGSPMEGPRDLQRVVASTPVGQKIRVTVLRDGREQQLDVTIGRYKASDERK
ncbi:MAG: endopeptidase [Candidatus Rokuibacteriota bacterium]|nr:MAG: endopeptidase [Candidatus Rokubacteria bacterium]